MAQRILHGGLDSQQSKPNETATTCQLAARARAGCPCVVGSSTSSCSVFTVKRCAPEIWQRICFSELLPATVGKSITLHLCVLLIREVGSETGRGVSGVVLDQYSTVLIQEDSAPQRRREPSTGAETGPLARWSRVRAIAVSTACRYGSYVRGRIRP
ncbi:hypothetical protein AAFF_G00273550 [Aldrovandia affinis]|uniref:Uncharacterized protein n=1 Tax=Aldrovandia affinis TaxID=143900 RepID=A0AAD7SRW4_9TELE|nr:hypothetical protein AAFF_G00273550 [Aldrovandia affinis]